jgi:DNA-binding response OmpR family regulator
LSGFNSMKILVVEDETPMAMMMVNLLTRVGYVVEVARTGHEAIELAAEEKFDAITLDVDLPDMLGFDVCRELKQRHISYRTPVLFLSSHVTEDRRQTAFEFGAADFIAKPFAALDFLNRIDSLAYGESDVFDERADAHAESLGNAAQSNQ